MAYNWWVPHAYLVVLVLTAVLCTVAAFWVHRRHDFRGKRAFVYTVASAVPWAIIAAVHVATTDETLMRWIVRLELGNGILTGALWLQFCSQYAGRTIHRNRWLHLVTAGTALVYLLAVLFNPWNLLFTGIPIYQVPFAHASADRGPLYFLLLVVPYGQSTAGLGMLLQFLFSTRRATKARMFLLATATPSILLLNTLSILDLTPVPEFEHASLGIFPFIFFLIITLFGFGSFNLTPIARSTLVETLDDSVIALDAAGNLVDYNPRAATLAPALEEHDGSPLDAVFPELAAVIANHHTGAVLTEELWLDTAAGERYYSVRVSPVTDAAPEEELLGYSILLRDITEVERSRRELRRQNEQLDQFASMVSHDLRNPLSVVNGFTDILEANMEQVHDEYEFDAALYEEPLTEIERARDRMETITDDMLTLAQEGKSVEETESLDFAAVTHEAWSNVETADASLSIETTGTVEANGSRLLSIFENLFRNSIDHAGESVTVTAGLLETGFFVADDGPGIPDEHADDVFEYGYTTSEAGTGLGLSIVETMIITHGWSVELDQDYEDGCRFLVTGVAVDDSGDELDDSEAVPSRTH